MHPDREKIQITDNYLSRGMTDGDAVWCDIKLFTDNVLCVMLCFFFFFVPISI